MRVQVADHGIPDLVALGCESLQRKARVYSARFYTSELESWQVRRTSPFQQASRTGLNRSGT